MSVEELGKDDIINDFIADTIVVSNIMEIECLGDSELTSCSRIEDSDMGNSPRWSADEFKETSASYFCFSSSAELCETRTPSESRTADSESCTMIFSHLCELEAALERELLVCSEKLQYNLLDSVTNCLNELAKKLKKIEDTQYLLPEDFEACCKLHDYFNLIRAKVNVEMAAFAQADFSAQIIAVIERQPFPSLFNKSMSMAEGLFKVQMIVSRHARKSLRVSDAELVLSIGGDVPSLPSEIACLENCSVTWEDSKGIYFARPSLKFLRGSGGKLLRLVFRCRVQVGAQVIIPESQPSRGFLVITNNSQWCSALSELIRGHVMDSRSERGAPISAVISALQWVLATMALKNNGTLPRRTFSSDEVHYIIERLNEMGDMRVLGFVSQVSFSKFWKIIENFFRSIRFQRHLGSMWQRGLLWICNRTVADDALSGKDTGTFLVRFTLSAESHSSRFVVVFVDKESNIRHYVIKETDLTKKKHLPEFLNNCSSLARILVLNSVCAVGGSNYYHCTISDLVAELKARAFDEYILSTEKLSVPKGYVLEI